ncbi:MAG: nitroreductase family protein, partial [Muribaculaceae bacterium]|nr:nitroreductase family protein [Muribaculaceae bacterium]
MNKSVETTLLTRRSIRRYEREQIKDEDMQFIYDAIRNTPTSYNGQQYSVIDLDDPSIKEQIYEITGQKPLKTRSPFLLFLADHNKIGVIAKTKGIDDIPFAETTDGL